MSSLAEALKESPPDSQSVFGRINGGQRSNATVCRPNAAAASASSLNFLTTKPDEVAAQVINLLYAFCVLIELSENAILIDSPGQITTL